MEIGNIQRKDNKVAKDSKLKDVVCYNCNKNGYLARNCFKNKN